jgi:hypothetical protein
MINLNNKQTNILSIQGTSKTLEHLTVPILQNTDLPPLLLKCPLRSSKVNGFRKLKENSENQVFTKEQVI